jgi:hypothetical protein
MYLLHIITVFSIICDEFCKCVGKFSIKNAFFKMFSTLKAPFAVLHTVYFRALADESVWPHYVGCMQRNSNTVCRQVLYIVLCLKDNN